MTQPTIFIVDDEAAVRDSLSLLLELGGWRVETHASAEAFLDSLEGRDPTGCVLADLCMPGMSGIDLIDALKQRGLPLPVIVITAHGDIPMSVAALKKGAVDFVEKPFDHQHLLESLREALESARAQRCRLSENQSLKSRLERLSPREAQVMELVIEGHSNKLIARQLDISPRTVEIHRARVMDKMEVRNLSELVRAMALAQLLPP